MHHLERLADILAIQDLNAAFAFHLDHDEVAPLLALFAPGATYSNGTRRSHGLDEIEAFYRGRTAAGLRTTRHLYSGLRIRFDGPSRAASSSVWMSFAHNGAPPVDDTVPYLVADFDDTYERGADGRWRILSRTILPIFRNPGGAPPGIPAPRQMG